MSAVARRPDRPSPATRGLLLGAALNIATGAALVAMALVSPLRTAHLPPPEAPTAAALLAPAPTAGPLVVVVATEPPTPTATRTPTPRPLPPTATVPACGDGLPAGTWCAWPTATPTAVPTATTEAICSTPVWGEGCRWEGGW